MVRFRGFLGMAARSCILGSGYMIGIASAMWLLGQNSYTPFDILGIALMMIAMAVAFAIIAFATWAVPEAYRAMLHGSPPTRGTNNE